MKMTKVSQETKLIFIFDLNYTKSDHYQITKMRNVKIKFKSKTSVFILSVCVYTVMCEEHLQLQRWW